MNILSDYTCIHTLSKNTVIIVYKDIKQTLYAEILYEMSEKIQMKFVNLLKCSRYSVVDKRHPSVAVGCTM